RRPPHQRTTLALRPRGSPLRLDPQQGSPGSRDPRRLRQPVWRDADDHPGPAGADRRPVRRPEQRLRRPARAPRPGRGRRADPHLPYPHPPSEGSEIVAFYVPLGPRGLLFRFGTILTGAIGSWVYWRASRRRAAAVAVVVPLPGAAYSPEV